MSSEELEVFLGDLHRDALETGRELVRRQGFEADTRLLDVGGGSGGLAIAVAEAVPGLRATVVELPAVAPITKRFIRKADASQTVRVQACNAAEQSPVGSFDVAVLKSLLQTLSPGQAQAGRSKRWQDDSAWRQDSHPRRGHPGQHPRLS